MRIVIYMVIPLYMGILYFLAEDELLPDEIKVGGVQGFFYKIGAYLYRRFLSKSSLFIRSPNRRKVQKDLQTLNSKTDVAEDLRIYYTKKIANVLILITAGAFLSLTAFVSSKRTTIFDESGYLIRRDYGKGTETSFLSVKGADGIDYGNLELEVQEREYTRQQADKLLGEMRSKLPQIILKDNENLSDVRNDLNLVESVPGYPFKIRWESENIDVIHTDGRVEADSVKEQGEKVLITARIEYKSMQWEEKLTVTVYPPKRTALEIFRNEIRQELEQREQSTRKEKSFELPQEIGEKRLLWGEKSDDKSPLLMIIVCIASFAIYIAKDQELSADVTERRRKLVLEYPQFVSRLVLYMGAGMSVRAILKLFAEEYKKEKRSFDKHSFLYEELLMSCHELESGVSELEVYERLAIRCGAQQYTRLVTLLSQNLKKGNSELLQLLKEEADKATSERMSYARKLGEEAGTKLLVPMVMMLMIVMVVIIVPAYLSF